LGDEATAAGTALVAAGVGVTAWLVGLHQSALATARPDLALRNAFGHPYRHALCPAQPEVVGYARGLVADAAAALGRRLLRCRRHLLPAPAARVASHPRRQDRGNRGGRRRLRRGGQPG